MTVPVLRNLLAALAALLLLVVTVRPLGAGTPVSGEAGSPPDRALAALLAEAQSAAAAARRDGDCAPPGLDRLARILCEGRIRVGVREDYPLFGTRDGQARRGYDVDAALAVARALGVAAVFTRVTPPTRIPMLADDRVDLVVATMGHNTQRDGQVRFIRPHYYRSETVLVGRRELPLRRLADIAGETVCVTMGNGSNAEIVSLGARLLLFDEPDDLIDNLRSEACALAAQDDAFFAWYFTDPGFAARFEQKIGFARVPWGMAVPAGRDSARLGHALDLVSQILHRDGTFLGLARADRIRTGFLEEQEAVWRRPDCDTADGSANPRCVLPALDTALAPTPFAGQVAALEAWLFERTGVAVTFAMLKTQPAWALLKAGAVNSLVLVLGALSATLGFALLLGAMLGGPAPLLRLPARAVVAVMQSSPVVLTLVIAAAIAQAAFGYSAAVALGAAIVALGLTNGSYAGQAIAEAMRSIQAEGSAAGRAPVFGPAIARSATQIMSFLVNAAKGTPVASFIGAPELLGTLTDITSFASGRATTYTLVLIFYVLVVASVVWLCGRIRARLERRPAATLAA